MLDGIGKGRQTRSSHLEFVELIGCVDGSVVCPKTFLVLLRLVLFVLAGPAGESC